MDRSKALGALSGYFGYSSFREGQEEAISHILSGADVLGVMPTGAGKSICYQLPALVMPGLTLVVSPLISLMKDQVEGLRQAGVAAACINSTVSPAGQHEALRRAMSGELKIIYVAPERLLMEEFLGAAARMDVSMVTVDEAHCVSQWGQDFRPSYLDIPVFVERLGRRPVVSAFTATATGRVREDITSLLRMSAPFVVSTGFDRKNLFFEVRKPQSKMKELMAYLGENRGKSGIVYCATRKTVDEVSEALAAAGHPATRYHAGLGEAERHSNQDDFIYDRKAVMVATNAFGMGIDKSDVGYVIHYNMPKNVESYYQEAGRAGRDGAPADCILLYSGQDVRINRFLIQKGVEANEGLAPEAREALTRKDEELLKAMTWYCAATECLRSYILRYFGERPAGRCGNCGNCNTNYETVDVTDEARKIISCVFRLGERRLSFGKTMVAQILRGQRNERIMGMGLDTLSTYGIMADVPVRRIHSVIDHLAAQGYLHVSEGEYPTLGLAPAYKDVTRGGEAVTMELAKELPPKASKEAAKEAAARRVAGDGAPYDDALFQKLKALRSEIASRAGLPAFLVFADAALRDMCRKLPKDSEEFLQVSGVGQQKMEKYAEAFTGAVRAHLSNVTET